ncbi:acetyl-CoA carboxylase biotin carboxyl carrier protein, partial [bacterium]|nr:acetyl-CoA carboxylase biotin carboxyl carrier protein [bacterium]
SPMVGTFYAASSPTASPYVEVGNVISEGQVVCIIEAMKLMNEIEADISGKIVEICVQNGDTVEFGQTLMYVE